MTPRLTALALAGTIILFGAPAASAQALIEIVNADFPGVGFNDPTPAAPVGGNTGTTVGEQRLNAFRHAASFYAASLTSAIPIRIVAFFDETLACTAETGVLGAASPLIVLRDFPPVPGNPGLEPGTWYPIALAEKLTGFPVLDEFLPQTPFQAVAIFNPDVGQAGCLENSGWYYGLDMNAPEGQINMVSVLLHEFGHGLGFIVGPTDASTGARLDGFPSIWESRMGDLSLGRTWLEMSDEERAFSARNNTNLVWIGEQTTAALPAALDPSAELIVGGNPAIAGVYQADPALFGAPVPPGGLSGVITRARDAGGASAFDGCEPIVSDVAGRIALIDRGTCVFTQKALNAQMAGAIGVVFANNVTGLFTAGGTDPAVTIPVVGLSLESAERIRSAPQLSNPGDGGAPARLRVSTRFRQGTTAGFARLYAPFVFEPGSSVSHFDVTMTPNRLMEPAFNRDIQHTVELPNLVLQLLRDIGW